MVTSAQGQSDVPDVGDGRSNMHDSSATALTGALLASDASVLAL